MQKFEHDEHIRHSTLITNLQTALAPDSAQHQIEYSQQKDKLSYEEITRIDSDDKQKDKQQDQQQKTSVWKKILGMLIFSLSMVAFSLTTMMIKVTSKKFAISSQQVMYYFNIVTLALIYCQIRYYKIDILNIPQQSYKSLMYRSICGFLNDITLYVAMYYTNYSKAVCLTLTSSIMIPFFAACMLKEKIKKIDIIAIIASFIGMILIIQPFKSDGKGEGDMVKDLIGCLVALFSAVFSALAVVTNKGLADNLHFSVVNFYYIMSNVLFCPIWIFMAPHSNNNTIFNGELFGYILVCGIGFFLMMSMLTIGVKMISGAMSGLLLYIAIISSYVFDAVFLKTPIGSIELLGVFIIIGSNVAIGALIACKVVK